MNGACSTHELRNWIKTLVGKSEEKTPIERSRRRQEFNIIVDLRATCGMRWVKLT
jgi:hypothetical protein